MARFITGPATPNLVVPSNGVKQSGDEIRSNRGYYSSDWDSVLTDGRVSKGCWVFEVTVHGTVAVGWATNQFNSSDEAGRNADSWVLKIKEGNICHRSADGKGTNFVPANSLDGATISCVLEIDSCSIWYYSSGKLLGTGAAFTNVRGTSSTTFTPIVALSANGYANFKITPTVKYPIAGATTMAHEATEKQKKSINEMWTKYHNASISLSESGDRGTIKSQGILDLANDVLADEEKMQLVLAVLAWKFRANTAVWEFSEEEFVDGLTIYGIFDMATFQKEMLRWIAEIESTPHVFKSFYAFIFSYMLPPQRVVLEVAEAIETWGVVGFPPKWPELWPKWAAYMETKKTISKDAWVLVPAFLTAIKPDLSGFDENECWPAVFEDFVYWCRDNQK